MYDFNELGDEGEENRDGVLAAQYEEALRHRDKLLEFDKNAAKRLGVIDEKQDWYELSNNPWINPEQRNYAKQMLEVEKKRDEKIDESACYDINLETGQVKLRVNERDNAFAYEQQNKQVNEFLQNQLSTAGKSKIFKPFESEGAEPSYLSEVLDVEAQIASLSFFNIKASNLNDAKSKKLYE